MNSVGGDTQFFAWKKEERLKNLSDMVELFKIVVFTFSLKGQR